jgi:hypothetical protein
LITSIGTSLSRKALVDFLCSKAVFTSINHSMN